MFDNIAQFLSIKYGKINLKELKGGYTNRVFLLENTSPTVIAKISNISNGDSINEIKCLDLLKRFQCTPKVHGIFQFEKSRIIIMDYINGLNGQLLLEQNNIERAKKVYELLGKCLATEIHTIKYQNSCDKLPLIKKNNGGFDKLVFIPSSFIEEVEKILSTEEEENYVLIHGDFGPHNSLILNESVYVIDWEWSGWGNPLQDISWVVWFLKLHYPNKAHTLCNTFINSYKINSDISISPEQIKSYAISRVMNIMCRIINADQEVKNEWIKRLKWTLETDFTI